MHQEHGDDDQGRAQSHGHPKPALQVRQAAHLYALGFDHRFISLGDQQVVSSLPDGALQALTIHGRLITDDLRRVGREIHRHALHTGLRE